MQKLERQVIIQNKILFILFIGLVLAAERYYVGIIPFTDGWILPVVFLISIICLIVLQFLTFSLLAFQFSKKVFQKKKIEKSTSKHIKKYVFSVFVSIGVFFFLVWFSLFNGYYKVEVINKSTQNAENIAISTSFTSDQISGLNLGSLTSHTSKTWSLKNLEDFPQTFKRKMTLKFKIGNEQKEISQQTSFLRTKFTIDDKHNFTSDLNCEQSIDLNYKAIDGQDRLLTTINLCDKSLEKYTIDIERFDDNNGAYIIINTPRDLRIKKAERILYWYPSIWAKQDDDLIQFIRLDDFLFQTTEQLRILSSSEAQDELLKDGTDNNVIYYSNIKLRDNDMSFFQNIEKKAIKKSIDSELKRPSFNYLNIENKQYEKEKWLKYPEEYTKGMFLDKSNDIFEVNCFDVYVKITFDNEKADYVRVLHQEKNIGN